ncbi:MAG: CpsB/CapC family capsule biosynthesis tyrosine phosphatase [Gaiellaceae bacterium]
MPAFVDCHSHVVPSGDDGAKTLAEGLRLCEIAAAAGTEILYATPHVWPHLRLTGKREAAIVEAFERLREQAPLELRLGYELTPSTALLDEDPARFVLQGTRLVLVEVPFSGPADELLALGEHIEAAGLVPLVAHPERTQAVQERPALALELAECGWPLQVNATSLLGLHRPEAEALGWKLVEDGLAKVVSSDGHRETRPPRLDEAYALAVARVGEDAALPLFDGSALELRGWRPTPSRAAARDA